MTLLGIEGARSNTCFVLSQRKYALVILEETWLMNSKFVDRPMDPNAKHLPNLGSLSEILRSIQD